MRAEYFRNKNRLLALDPGLRGGDDRSLISCSFSFKTGLHMITKLAAKNAQRLQRQIHQARGDVRKNARER